jgi:hypothetical protein
VWGGGRERERERERERDRQTDRQTNPEEKHIHFLPEGRVLGDHAHFFP